MNPHHLASLPNGVRVLVLPMPHLATASASVFVRCGSAHESRAGNGIGHVIEHMAFKGTATRDAYRINLDAERLGAEANAHTDKDHTAYHLRGLAAHAPEFVRMLADISCHPTFPDDELERERAVLLEELTEVEDDPVATAYTLFDRACYGLHPVAQPVIGTRANIQRFGHDDLAAHVRRHLTGPNVVLGVAGAVDAERIVAEAEAAFAGLPAGEPNLVPAPAYHGGLRTRRQDGSSQVHLALGFPLPALAADDPAGPVAAALFGEGMSSPLMTELREKRALVYHAACSADQFEMCGQFVIEASAAPGKLDELLAELTRLLLAQAERIGRVDLERARNQVAVKRLRNAERPGRCIEDAVLELFAIGRVRGADEWTERARAVGPATLRRLFEGMLKAGASIAITGQVARGTRERVAQIAAPLLRG